MTAERIITWGILGCGDVTEVKSGPALQKAAGSRLVCVMRRDADLAADYAIRHNVPRWTSDAETLISDPELDAIYIATPPSTHADFAIRALQAGKNVLLEKPISVSAAQSDAIEDAVKQTGKKLCVAYYRRALPRFEKVRALLQTGEIGAIRMIEVRQFKPLEAQSSQAWKTDPAVGGGGSFVDMQTHTLDWLAYVFGAPQAICGIKRNQAGVHNAEDMVNYLADFGEFSAQGLCSYAASHDEEKVVIHGAEGRLEMGFFRPAPIVWHRDGTEEIIDLPDPPHVHQPFIERVNAYFRGQAENPCSAAAGRVASDLVDQIFRGL